MEVFRTLTLEVTTHCQANCIVCVRDKIKYKLGNMTQKLFETAIEQVDSCKFEVKMIDVSLSCISKNNI